MRLKISQIKPVVVLILFSISLPLRTINIVHANETAEIADPIVTLEATDSADNPDISETIETGTASAVLSAENVVNTTAIDTANDAPVASETEPLDGENFQLEAACSELNNLINELDIEINNQTTIDQVLNMLADSGHNSIETGQITTGDAQGDVQFVQQINTTLIGSCWSYLDKVIFDETSEDVYLPYEAEILDKASQESSLNSQAENFSADISNDAVNNQEINQTADTGNNSVGGGGITTGNSTISTQTIDTVNKNILGDNWFYLEINNPWYWSGNIVGREIYFVKTDEKWYYWDDFGAGAIDGDDSESTASTENISVNNTAKINTEINSMVNTGNNQIENSGSIITGDAVSSVKIRNNINTTIIGSNWYYASINLFAPFSGNLVFSRANLIADILSGSLFLRPGDILDLPIKYQNTGQTVSKNTIIKVGIPGELELIESFPSTFNSYASQFNLGNLQPGDSGIVSLKFKTKNILQRIDSKITVEIESDTIDSNLVNNYDQISVVFEPNSTTVSNPEEETEKEALASAEITELPENKPEILSVPIAWEPQSVSEGQILGVKVFDDSQILFSPKNIACIFETVSNQEKPLSSYLIFREFQTLLSALVEWLRKIIV